MRELCRMTHILIKSLKGSCPSLNSFSSYCNRADDSLSAKKTNILKKGYFSLLCLFPHS